jgi:hypothetical protein
MALMDGFKLRRRRTLPWALGALAVLSLLALVGVVLAGRYGSEFSHVREFAIAAVGGTAALLYFLYKQHLDETRLFLDLFRDFNARFDKLNDRLNAIVGGLQAEPGASLTDADRQTLFDYFNLCAEEFLFAEAGCLDPEVWKSWRRGMRVFAAPAAIRSLWEGELASGSYYGFSLQVVDRD